MLMLALLRHCQNQLRFCFSLFAVHVWPGVASRAR